MKYPSGQKKCWSVRGIQAKWLGNVMGWSYKVGEFMGNGKKLN
jgi:hypothetical protein